MLEQDNPESVSNNLPLEVLQNMELPKIPADLSHLLSVTWRGRGGEVSPSAVSAQTNKNGQPMVTLTMVYKKYIHEEVLPFKQAEKDTPLFEEVLRELY